MGLFDSSRIYDNNIIGFNLENNNLVKLNYGLS